MTNDPIDRGADPIADDPCARGNTEAPACAFCGLGIDRQLTDNASSCSRCSSPLAPAMQRRPEGSARRTLRRIDRRAPVTIRANWESQDRVEGTMQNLSLNGMRFSSPQRFDYRQVVQVISAQCQAVGRVTHCQESEDGHYCTGLQFITVHHEHDEGPVETGAA